VTRILQLAPVWEAVPPPGYGGTEAVVGLLTEELVRRGCDVTLAASGDSRTSADHVCVYEKSLRRADDLGDKAPYEWVHVAQALKHGRDFDVIHNHAGELGMAMSALVDVPVLTTAHCLPTRDNLLAWRTYEGAYNTISRSERCTIGDAAPLARYMGHVYNAIDVESFPFQEEKGEDLLFLSRLAPEKGPQHAIEVARRTGRRLIMAGKVDAFDRDFFEEVVRDQIDGEHIVFVGEADAHQKRELYRQAKCLLMPIDWEEPFGLVMPEAMACGTPVIAFARGSAPELILDGETGFVVRSAGEMADAVADVGRIDPARCREHVARNFSPEIMTDGYLRVYDELLERPRRRSALVIDEAVSHAIRGEDSDEALAVA
jgi:glycosyltransferase involved in cell wall biosynthesis